ncbi:MAG: dihydroorotase [Inconstantimicrobium porci]|uniref:dihydroorotase n=1 Tax=Inconstantimicrobium porci TaxID=2652291 RepID=UPI002A919515|nr:dihydroorotase [Inconstantimicrobium porci]MDY5913329.1 dihydroorotase [Inconstantimicrobium porci]
MDLLIKNAHIIDSYMDFYGDLYIKEGKIYSIGNNLSVNCETIDADGKTVMPSFIDTHAHFRDPGFTYKEDIETGSMAAARGGYTAVDLMANTKPVCSSREVLNYVKEKAEKCNLIDIIQCVTVSKDMEGKTTSHLDEFDKDEVRVISDDGRGVADSKVMMDAMYKAKKNGWLVLSHAESKEFSDTDMRTAENMMTLRDVTLAGITGAKLHMAHVSTKEAMQYIIDAKNKKAHVTAEVTPHHIALTSDVCNYRVNPPIREKEDVEFLIDAIKKGYVDTIGTDHAPHSKEDKANGAPGMIGLETAFSVCYTALVKMHDVSINKLSSLMSEKPAELLKLNKGRIVPGYDGDIVIADLDYKYTVSEKDLASKSCNTPFLGKELCGKVIMTIKNGRVIYKAMEEE